MSPETTTQQEREVAEEYWGVPWTQLSEPQIKEALIWKGVLASLVVRQELTFPPVAVP